MSQRNIVTTYFDHKGREVQINRSLHPRKAVMAATDHLSQDHYWRIYDDRIEYAHAAVIYDDNTAELHAVVVWDTKTNEVRTSFKRDPQKPTCIIL